MSTRAMCHILIVLIASWTSVTCSVEADSNPVDRIINGEETRPGEFPFLVSVGTRKDGHRCGGSIIDEYHILTAGHCLAGNFSPGELTVRIGCHRIVDCPATQVAKYTIHANNPALQNDIALIKTLRPMPINRKVGLGAIGVAELPKSEFIDYQDGEALTVAGWGFTSRTVEEISDVPRKIVVDTMNLDRCKELPLMKFMALIGIGITKRNICAGSYSRNSFKGDSGGPLMNIKKTTKPELVGIVSWDPSFFKEYTGVFARVSSFIDWINETKLLMAN